MVNAVRQSYLDHTSNVFFILFILLIHTFLCLFDHTLFNCVMAKIEKIHIYSCKNVDLQTILQLDF